jgi:tetratricopeptide (TPR) repeat protein
LNSELNKRYWFLSTVFLLLSLLLIPLGNFNDWISPTVHTGFYSLNNIDPGDDTGYQAYLRSGLIDGDFDFINEINYAHRETFMPTGYVFNNWQIGQSLLFFPFFLAGHIIALILNASGFKISTDGYSIPYYMSTAIAAHAYLFIGLLQLNKIVRRATTEQIALLVTISIWLCSPLIYFSFVRDRMAHTTEFFMAVMFLTFWLRLRESGKPIDHAFLGALLGLFCMIRIINISFFALYFFDQIILKKPFLLKTNQPHLKNFLNRSFWMVLFFLLALSPQLFLWQKLNGVPLPIRHFGMAGAGLTFIFTPEFFKKLFNVFFSLQWGVLFSFPIFIFSVLGLYADKQFNPIRPGLIAYLVAIVFIISVYPENSDSYGERHFISSIPLLAIGLTGILNWASSAKTKKMGFMVFSLIGICLLCQYSMLAQYKIIIPHNDPEFSFKAITHIPKLLFEHTEALLRSSNWFRLITLNSEATWNFKDVLFMIVFPIAQTGVLFLICFLFHNISSLKVKQENNFNPKYYLTIIVSITILLIFLITVLTPTKNQKEIELRHDYANLLKQARLYQKKNNPDQALKHYLKASNQSLSTLIPFLQMGLIHHAKSNFAESNKNFQKVLSIDPNHQTALLNLGDNFNILGDYENAEKNLRIATKFQSPIAETFDALGQVYAKQNRLIDSEKMFKTAITLKPDYAKAHLNLSILYTQTGEKQKAIYHLEETVRLGITNQTVIDLIKLYGRSLKRIDS